MQDIRVGYKVVADLAKVGTTGFEAIIVPMSHEVESTSYGGYVAKLYGPEDFSMYGKDYHTDTRISELTYSWTTLFEDKDFIAELKRKIFELFPEGKGIINSTDIEALLKKLTRNELVKKEYENFAAGLGFTRKEMGWGSDLFLDPNSDIQYTERAEYEELLYELADYIRNLYLSFVELGIDTVLKPRVEKRLLARKNTAKAYETPENGYAVIIDYDPCAQRTELEKVVHVQSLDEIPYDVDKTYKDVKGRPVVKRATKNTWFYTEDQQYLSDILTAGGIDNDTPRPNYVNIACIKVWNSDLPEANSQLYCYNTNENRWMLLADLKKYVKKQAAPNKLSWCISR